MNNDDVYNCIKISDIYDIADGIASEELCSVFAKHIEVCERCRHEYENIIALKKVMRECTSEPGAEFAKNTMARLRTVRINPFIKITGHPVFRAVAAAAACLVLIIAIYKAGLTVDNTLNSKTPRDLLYSSNDNAVSPEVPYYSNNATGSVEGSDAADNGINDANFSTGMYAVPQDESVDTEKSSADDQTTESADSSESAKTTVPTTEESDRLQTPSCALAIPKNDSSATNPPQVLNYSSNTVYADITSNCVSDSPQNTDVDETLLSAINNSTANIDVSDYEEIRYADIDVFAVEEFPQEITIELKLLCTDAVTDDGSETFTIYESRSTNADELAYILNNFPVKCYVFDAGGAGTGKWLFVLGENKNE